MIFGIGTDILKLDRVGHMWERFGQQFATRILLSEELDYFGRAKDKARFLAMRFAAKEAIAKAMGTGFAHGIWVRDVGRIPNDWGQPQVIFSERGHAVCRQLGIGGGFVSLTDEAGLVVAMAVLMKAEPVENEN